PGLGGRADRGPHHYRRRDAAGAVLPRAPMSSTAYTAADRSRASRIRKRLNEGGAVEPDRLAWFAAYTEATGGHHRASPPPRAANADEMTARDAAVPASATVPAASSAPATVA